MKIFQRRFMAEEMNQEVQNAIPEESVESVQEETPETAQATDNQAEDEKNASAQPGESNDRGEPEYVKHVNNWRSLREGKERAERERDELLAKMKAMQKGGQEEEDISFSDDDLIEGKHLKKTMSKTESRIKQLEGQLIEAQIRAKYPDFDKVVTPDTLGMLKDTDPELAESLAMNPNLYSQAIAAYKSIKRYGIADQSYDRDKEVVNKNVAKPRTVTSLNPQQGESPLSRANAFANGLTDDLKKQMWQEMQDIVNNS